MKFFSHLLSPLPHVAALLSLAMAVAIVGGGAYGYLKFTSLTARVEQLQTQLASTTAYLESTISHSSDVIALQQQRVHEVQQQLGGFANQVDTITGTVGTLEKLAKTDPELLAKYSKIFFLSENYAPERLSEIPDQYKYTESKVLQIIPEVLPRLSAMLDAAKKDGVDIFIESSYRSYKTQEVLKENYKFTYGAGTANQFSADQGYSEHQLGTTLDFITTGTDGHLYGFDTRPAYDWLQKNAYKYGFILSYPKGNSYYIYEPWHWRFVGVKLATDLHNQGKNFYDLDQRTIDTYLVSIFD